MDDKGTTTSNEIALSQQQQLDNEVTATAAAALTDNREIDALTAFLVGELGRRRFESAVDFLSGISERMGQGSEGDDDEYLLDNAERILGADGLVYLDDLFLLITHMTEAGRRWHQTTRMFHK